MTSETLPLYNSLKHITEAQHSELNERHTLVALIEEYKLPHLIGICRLHRHFLID